MVYIQSDTDRKLPHHFDAACALYGAIDSSMNFRLTSYEEVKSGKFDNLIKTHLFVGSVEFMQEVFSRVGKTPKPIINSDRTHLSLTMKQVREIATNDDKVFVKPFQQKLFTGLQIDKYSISSLREHSDDLIVMGYEIIENIQSEWRLYVLHGKIEDARNYSGDFKIIPDFLTAENKIKSLRNSLPSAFTMDIGIAPYKDLGAPYTFIVEFNDMYAIGNYGVDNSLYLRMLRERYFEIMRHE